MAKPEDPSGYVVRVTTPRLGGGDPMHIPYIVVESDPQKAEEIIRTIMTRDEKVTAIWPLPASVINDFGLKQGEFTHG